MRKQPFLGTAAVKATGAYVTTSTVGESSLAFAPDPLPPDSPVQLTGHDHDLIEKANRALGRLDAVNTLLPQGGRVIVADQGHTIVVLRFTAA